MKRQIISLVTASCALVLFAASCATPKKVVYLQDMANNTQINLENKIEAVIVPYDELDIIISCLEAEVG